LAYSIIEIIRQLVSSSTLSVHRIHLPVNLRYEIGYNSLPPSTRITQPTNQHSHN